MKMKHYALTLLALITAACSQYKPPVPATLLDANGSPVTPVKQEVPGDSGTTSDPAPIKTGDGFTASTLGAPAEKLYKLLSIEEKIIGNQVYKSGKAYECSFTETEKPEVQYRCDFIFNPKNGESAPPKNTGTAGKALATLTADEMIGPLALTLKDQSGSLLLNAQDSQALYQSLDFKPVELAATADFNVGYVKNAKNLECTQSNPKSGKTNYLCKVIMKPATGETMLAAFYVP